jgi:hypothetical protein
LAAPTSFDLNQPPLLPALGAPLGLLLLLLLLPGDAPAARPDTPTCCCCWATGCGEARVLLLSVMLLPRLSALPNPGPAAPAAAAPKADRLLSLAFFW